MAHRVVVVGGGFAGVWSALSAARHLDELGIDSERVRVSLVSADPWLTIRPRLHERRLDGLRVPLDRLLSPAGVERVEGFVTEIDLAGPTVTVRIGDHLLTQPYDRLVLAAGSHVQRPPLPGLHHASTVDTYGEAVQLERAFTRCPPESCTRGSSTPSSSAPASPLGGGHRARRPAPCPGGLGRPSPWFGDDRRFGHRGRA